MAADALAPYGARAAAATTLLTLPYKKTGATIQVTMTVIIFPNIYFSAPQQETGDSIACITHQGIINPHKNPDKFERQKYDKNIYIYKPYLCY